MSIGIILCGLNGAGKSTLGRALGAALGCRFLDIEDYYFPKRQRYDQPRSREDMLAALLPDLRAAGNFVLAAVNVPEEAISARVFTHAVVLCVPSEERARRLRQRSQAQFGDRALPGGDLYAAEQRFFAMAAARDEEANARWAAGLGIPVLTLDGTRAVEENAQAIRQWIKNQEA